MQGSQGVPCVGLPRSLAEQAALMQKGLPTSTPLNLAPFSIQRTLPGRQGKSAGMAAERMQKVCLPQHCTAHLRMIIGLVSSSMHDGDLLCEELYSL